MSQVLKLSSKLINLITNNEKVLKNIRIYGFSSGEDFLIYVIEKLNSEYDFLNIIKYEEYETEFYSTYYTYNGYIEGDLKGMEEITVSFTMLTDGKSGNVFFNQQVVPMIGRKLKKNLDFLINDKIKKICLLTTHLGSVASPENNKLTKPDNLIQMTLNLANTIGFDCISIFRIKNTKTKNKYKNASEFINHSTLIQKLNSSNSNHQQIVYNNNGYIVSFDSKGKIPPQGQTIKFLVLKTLALIHLTRGENIDLSLILEQSKDSNIKILENYKNYVKENKNLSNLKINKIINEHDIEEAEEILSTDGFYFEANQKEVVDEEPKFGYTSLGRKRYKRNGKIIDEAIKENEFICLLHDEKHYYFKSEKNKRNYVEGHHMIPMEYQEDYWLDLKINLDCKINIAPLCPYCHRKIHHAEKWEKLDVIKNLYNSQEKKLKIIDKEISLEKFASFYNIYVY